MTVDDGRRDFEIELLDSRSVLFPFTVYQMSKTTSSCEWNKTASTKVASNDYQTSLTITLAITNANRRVKTQSSVQESNKRARRKVHH